MTEQAGPLPILILATIFLVVWNMDPFVIEEGNATPNQGGYKTLQSSTMGAKGDSPQGDSKIYVTPHTTPFLSGNTNLIQRAE